ncbi:P-loop containing nucleoside triphosphate hydrolase protein [Globomyces pollinis-pini]|nr:P-loop containing nucleoside triphosphate hydrolase protein [Globomyces pollinis-pini]
MAPWFGEWFKAIDQRLSKTREILLAMRIIKYKGYEDFFRSVIHNLRKLEVIIFRKLATAQLINQGFTNTFPAMIPVSAFLIYSSMGNPLTPDVVFPCLSLFVSLQNPLYQATMVITSFAKYYYSWIRVCSFMNAAEVQQRLKDKSIQSHILIQDGVFKHHTADSTDDSTESAFQLESLSIDIQPGSLIGIVGSVGAGKSSLLSAIMGQMNLKSGELIVNGSLAYCQQQPWIQSGTLRDNILFTSELNNQKLNECIDVCGMSADLLQLPDGINTELGENGITLSGGQKSRLALARAIYKNSDIYLLDDPLASLDSKVCLSVFENAILRKLKSKTVLLVTHQLHLMKRVDKILVLKEGKLVGFGKYDELKSNNDYFRDLTADYEIGEVGDVALDSGANGESAISDYSSDVGSGKKVIEEEERIKGKTKKETIFEFIKSMGVGFLSFNVFSFLCSIGFSISQNLYLTQQTEKPTVENSFFVTYALLGLGQSIAAVGMYNLFFASVYIAQKLHKKALIGIFGAPISFFDSQPVGRILNRFSSDLMGVNMMCNTGIYLTGSIVALITTTILISQANAMLLLLLVVLSISFWHLYNFFQKSNIELQRITSIRKSPVDSHVSVSISGNDTICCFGLQNQYFESFLRKVDDYLTAEYLRATLRIWVFLRMSVLSSLITATVLIILFCFPEQMGGVGSVGLSLVNAVGFSTSMFKFLLYLGEAESELNAFERLSFYGNSLPKESEYVLPSDPTKDDWPINGKVEFENVELSYAANLDRPVIKNVTVTFNAGEKIGVCGRTGSGKSTFASAFFRMVDITNGTIKIDGKDISKIGLHTLRSRVEMIPQEPILFNGTWRFNLDIEDKYSDHEIWNALDLVGLKQQLWDSSDKLSTEITDGGENLSFGQRQLLCLARAILSSPKILIMDEATSSIDSESDQLIQTILKVHFKDTTVISIAHRLNTIAAFDKVLVLDDGNLMEFDSPSNLINRNGIFAELVSATGPLNEAVIRGIIKKEQS